MSIFGFKALPRSYKDVKDLVFPSRPGGKAFTARKRNREEQPIQVPSADFVGRLKYKGRPQDDKFMRAVFTQTTPPHCHPEADL
jgi:hypothetical protein